MPATADEWKPIETAPKTGLDLRAVSLLAWVPHENSPDGGDVRVIWWEPLMNNRQGCWWGDRDFVEEPTHWMECPPKPTDAKTFEKKRDRR